MRPLVLPDEAGDPAELPVFRLQIPTVSEQFRRLALPDLRVGRPATLPRAPLTKAELKAVATGQWEKNEILTLGQLAA